MVDWRSDYSCNEGTVCALGVSKGVQVPPYGDDMTFSSNNRDRSTMAKPARGALECVTLPSLHICATVWQLWVSTWDLTEVLKPGLTFLDLDEALIVKDSAQKCFANSNDLYEGNLLGNIVPTEGAVIEQLQ